MWALIEAEDGGVFRSDDAGATWKRTNNERRLRQRAWYYTHIFADPKNADSVYVLNTGFFRSQDGGRTFTPIRVPHGDNHDLWIAPDDPQRMINGNDGGANVSFDGGRSWSRQDNQPTAQMYHVITDTRFPYFVYGAQQDNTTVAIASASNEGGIDAHAVVPGGRLRERLHRAQPGRSRMVVYAGLLRRPDHALRPPHRAGARHHRLAGEPDGLGRGGDEVPLPVDVPHRVLAARPEGPLHGRRTASSAPRDEGQTWEAISGDLTRNDPSKLGSSGGPITKDNTSVEYYGTVFALRGVAAREGRALGGLGRRPRARLARRRQDAGRTSRRARCRSGASSARSTSPPHAGRHRLPGHHALQARRLDARTPG